MTLALFFEMLTRDPVLYISIIIAVVISITLHELGHGIAAVWQGDNTPKILGHMTLDPRAHMPPMSWVLLLLVGISYGLMPVNPHNFRSKYGDALVAFAGPAVNLILAILGFGVWLGWLGLAGEAAKGTSTGNFQTFFEMFGVFNLVLFGFNLLPVPPLDGSTVLGNFFPAFKRAASDPGKRMFFLGVFVLIFFFAGTIWAAAYRTADALRAAFGV